MANPGYTDTPIIPGQKWRVHDAERPLPPVVAPGADSAQPPSDAVVLFDGSSLDSWVSAKDGQSPAAWKVENGYAEVVKGAGNIQTRVPLGDGQYHVEWRAPETVEKSSQGRGNSGVFLLSLYELQVLDGHDNPTYADGLTGGIYGQWPPLANACRKPGEWQTFDIVFTGPRFDGERLAAPGYVTLFHNGVVVHYHRELLGPTQHKRAPAYEPHEPERPLMLQDHGDPVRFRNMWYRRLGELDAG